MERKFFYGLLFTLLFSKAYCQNYVFEVTKQFIDISSGNYVNTIDTDSKGNIWVGTKDKGISVYDGINYRNYNVSNSTLPSNKITDIKVDSKDCVWLGTSDFGLLKFENDIFTNFNISNSKIPSNKITTLAISKGDTIWIGTADGGAAKFFGGKWNLYKPNIQSGEVVQKQIGNYTYINDTRKLLPGLPWENILKIKIDSLNNIWFGTYNELTKFDGKNWTPYKLTDLNMPNDYLNDFIINNNSIWVVTFKGIVIFEPETGHKKEYNVSNSVLKKNLAWSIDKYKNEIVIGTDAGLVIIKEKWEVISTQNSNLNNNRIFTVFYDRAGKIWIGCRNGILGKLNK